MAHAGGLPLYPETVPRNVRAAPDPTAAAAAAAASSCDGRLLDLTCALPCRVVVTCACAAGAVSATAAGQHSHRVRRLRLLLHPHLWRGVRHAGTATHTRHPPPPLPLANRASGCSARCARGRWIWQGNAFREFVERCQLLVNNPNVPDELQRPLSRRECDAMFQQANVEVRHAAVTDAVPT